MIPARYIQKEIVKHVKLNEESDTVTHYDQCIEDNYDESRP